MYRNYRCGCNNAKTCNNNYVAPVLAVQNNGCGCNSSQVLEIKDNECGCNSNSALKMQNYMSNYACSCGFDRDNGMPEYPELAQCYVPIQQMNQIFEPCTGLEMGTIFPELVRPYVPYQSIAESAHIEAMNVIREGCNSGM